MSNIKKFRIKSFKEKSSILKLEKITLKYGRKIILDNLNLQLNNGQILGFNVDRAFGNSIDCLLWVDLTKTDEILLKKYMGRENAETFLDRHAGINKI